VTLVLDASVLLKWFLQEPGSDSALELKHRYLEGDVAIALPDLALYEVPNVLRFKRELNATLMTADEALHRSTAKFVHSMLLR